MRRKIGLIVILSLLLANALIIIDFDILNENVTADGFPRDIFIEVHRIMKIDPIDGDGADWYFYVGVDEGMGYDWQMSDEPVEVDLDHLIVDEVFNFTVSSSPVSVGIYLCEDDNPFSDDLADISPYPGNGTDDSTVYQRGATCIVSYNLSTHSWTGDVNGSASTGYSETNGEGDGSASVDTNDAVLWFMIWDDTRVDITFPVFGVPLIQPKSNPFDIDVHLESVNPPTSWNASIFTEYDSYDLQINNITQNDTYNWTLTVQAPLEARFDLCDLKVEVDGVWDIEPHTISLIDSFSSDFEFIQITDLHIDDPAVEYQGIPPDENNLNETNITRNVIQEINLIYPDFVIISGDIGDNPEGIAQNEVRQYEKAREVLLELQVPAYIVSGNHDWRDDAFEEADISVKTYHEYINRDRDFNFTYGNSMFVGLDSGADYLPGIPLFDIQGDGLEQYQIEYLNSSLQGHSPNFVFMHHTALDPNGAPDIYDDTTIYYRQQEFLDTCVVNNVELVLTGHTHIDEIYDSEDSNPQTGTAVGNPTPPLYIQTKSATHNDTYYDEHGYRLIRISGGSVANYTYDRDGNGQRDADSSIVAGKLNLTFFPANDGIADTVTATIENDLHEDFYDARLVFKMPKPLPGWGYFAINGSIEQKIELATYDVYYVRANITKESVKEVILQQFIIDFTPPTITLNSPANNSVIPAGTILDFNVSDIFLNIVNYSVNGGPNTSFPVPYDIDTIGWVDGTYIIEIYANDTVGNTAFGSYNFTVDSTDPVIILNSPANNSVIPAGTIIELDVTDANIDQVNYSINGEANQTLNLPYNVDTIGWSDGTYTIEVHAIDKAGNTAVEIYGFTIDSTAPTITLNSPTNNSIIIGGTPLDFSIADPNLMQVNYSINGGVNTSLFDPFDIPTSGWLDGDYTVQINAQDMADNSNSTWFFFEIDSTKPIILLKSPGNNSVIPNGMILDFSIIDLNLMQANYSINVGVNNPFSSPFNISTGGWMDGEYILQINTLDLAGNSNSSWFFFTIDSTKPAILLNSPGNNSIVISGTILDFIVTDTNLMQVNYSINGDTNISLSQPFNISTTGWAEGEYIIQINALDLVGNSDSSWFFFTIDSTPPTILLNAPENNSVIPNGTLLDFSIMDTNLMQVNYSVNGGTDITLSDPFDISTAGWTDGDYTIQINALDLAGNTNSCWFFFIIDSTPPTITNVKAIPDPQEVDRNVNISANVSDLEIDTVWINITYPNGSSVGNFTMTYMPSAFEHYKEQNYFILGTYHFTIWAKDVSGNWNSTSGVFVVGRVPDAPTNLIAIAGDSYVNITWDAPASDGGSSIVNYRIYRSSISGDENFLVEIVNILHYNDTSVTNDITYYYKVSARNMLGEGELSDDVNATPSAPVFSDLDQDGLLDNWEQSYFGNLDQGPDGDYDGDDYTNLKEHRAGTDPTDENNYPGMMKPEEEKPFFTHYWWAFVIIAVVILTLIAVVLLRKRTSPKSEEEGEEDKEAEEEGELEEAIGEGFIGLFGEAGEEYGVAYKKELVRRGEEEEPEEEKKSVKKDEKPEEEGASETEEEPSEAVIGDEIEDAERVTQSFEEQTSSDNSTEQAEDEQ